MSTHLLTHKHTHMFDAFTHARASRNPPHCCSLFQGELTATGHLSGARPFFQQQAPRDFCPSLTFLAIYRPLGSVSGRIQTACNGRESAPLTRCRPVLLTGVHQGEVTTCM